MKFTLLLFTVIMFGSLVRCQSKNVIPRDDYKNDFGSLLYKLPDSVMFTSNDGNEKTIYRDASMRAKNLVLYKDMMMYTSDGVLYTFDFKTSKKDTVVTSESIIYGNQFLISGDTVIIYNPEKLILVDMNSQAILREFDGEFSNVELVKNQLFYSQIENHVETGVYQVDLGTNITKKLLHIPKHTFSYMTYPIENWSGMKVVENNLFIHSDDRIYIIDLKNQNSELSFSTKYSGGVIFWGVRDKIVEFEDEGETILIDLNNRTIKR